MITLPLTTFEEYLLWEDRPAYPWSCFIRLRLSGRLRRRDFQAALAQVLTRHPLLQSKVERQARKWQWVLSNDSPEMTWSEQEQPSSELFPPAVHLDLRSEIGLRIHVTVHPEDSTLVVQFHHACCDGAGIMAFIEHLLLAYARELGGGAPSGPLPHVDPTTLRQRGRYSLTWSKLLRILPQQLVGLQGVKQFLQRAPAPLIPHNVRSHDEPPPPGYPAALSHRLTSEQTQCLRERAQQRGVTSNDILARDLFLAMMAWQCESDCGDERQWLRMMVPMNLRGPSNPNMPAANCVSSVFLDRHRLQGADPDQLLASIHDEMQLIKDNQLGLTFLFSLALFKRLPGGLCKTARADKCTVTCIFTNLGELFTRPRVSNSNGESVFGDLTLNTVQVLAPLRPYNCVSFAAHRYAGRLGIDLHYDPQVLTTDQARRLLSLFVEKTTISIGHRRND